MDGLIEALAGIFIFGVVIFVVGAFREVVAAIKNRKNKGV